LFGDDASSSDDCPIGHRTTHEGQSVTDVDMSADRHVERIEIGVAVGVVGESMCPDLGIASPDRGAIKSSRSNIGDLGDGLNNVSNDRGDHRILSRSSDKDDSSLINEALEGVISKSDSMKLQNLLLMVT
jgi:hypothetical protein